MSERGRQQAGFTLLELLFSLLIIAVGILATVPMFVLAVRENAVGQDFGSAGARAVERMELLRTQDLRTLPAGGSIAADVTGYHDASDPDYLVRWEVADDGAPVGSKTIRVRVIPEGRTIGETKPVTLAVRRSR